VKPTVTFSLEYQTTSRQQTLEQIISGNHPLLWDVDKNEAPTDISTYHLHFTWRLIKQWNTSQLQLWRCIHIQVKSGFTSFSPTYFINIWLF